MGRGDKRTKRGKIAMGSFGKTRLARTAGTKPAAAPVASTETTPSEEGDAARAARPRKKKTEE